LKKNKNDQVICEIIRVDRLIEFSSKILEDPIKYEIQPIDQIRAYAHSRNPNASPHDIGLVVSYFNNKCIGYTGVIASKLNHENKSYKIYSHTTFYVDPSFRHYRNNEEKTVGEMMIGCVLSSGNGLITTGLSDKAEQFFKRNRKSFTPLPALEYYVLPLLKFQPVFRIERKILKIFKSYHILRAFSSVLKGCQVLVDCQVWKILLIVFRIKKSASKLFFKEVSELQSIDYYGDSQVKERGSFLERSHRIINWMLKDLWVVVSSELSNSGYLFEIRRTAFQFRAYEIFDSISGSLLGYMTLSISQKDSFVTLKVLDLYVVDEVVYSSIVAFILKNQSSWRVNTIVVPSKLYDALSQFSFLRKCLYLEKRSYYISFPAKMENPETFCFKASYCDGDRSFA
jgi:hypothetical protein